MASSCCPPEAPEPVKITYTPIGKTATISAPAGPLELYTTGSGNKAIVIVPDIFGWAFPQVFQVADRLAAAGFLVATPDVFRGQPWTKTDIRPEDNVMAWIKREGDYGKVAPDVKATIEHLRGQGATSFGIVGFCWGASISLGLAGEGLVAACAGVHPSLFGQDAALAEKVDVPLALLPSSNDPPEALVKDVMDRKPVGPKCVFERYDDQLHGFCAARGDWSKPEVAAGATKAIGTLQRFFAANL